MLPGLGLILLLIFAASFFVASEYSIVSVRKTRIEQLISEGSSVAQSVKHAIEHLDRYIAAVQIGITLVTLALGAVGEPVLSDIFITPLGLAISPITAFVSAASVSYSLSFLTVTVLEIVLGEIVPKIIARQRAEATVMLLIRPLNFFVFIFGPLIWLVSLLSNAVLRLVGVSSGSAHQNVYSVEELEMLVVSSRQAGVLDREEEVILRRVFDFGDLTARQVMHPRTEVMGISVDATFDEVITVMSEYKHSRFPVYEGDLDSILGVLYIKDVFALLAERERQFAGGQGIGEGTGNRQFNVQSLMRPIQSVPETLDVDELLIRMRQGGMHMAVVVDEYGGTAGVVTLEDIIEEIVGEVRDEFEPGKKNPDIIYTPEGIIVDGLLPIDDVNEVLGLSIESEADTIGGYVFEKLGRKPELHDEVTAGGYTLRVEALDGLRISQVKLLPHNGNNPQVASEDE